jgi:hypothetical protein
LVCKKHDDQVDKGEQHVELEQLDPFEREAEVLDFEAVVDRCMVGVGVLVFEGADVDNDRSVEVAGDGHEHHHDEQANFQAFLHSLFFLV